MESTKIKIKGIVILDYFTLQMEVSHFPNMFVIVSAD
jgi:hypothetical protein